MINIPTGCVHVEEWSESDIPGTEKFVCRNNCGYSRYIQNEHNGG